MSKDSFQILADELTLIRQDMAKLQRTSLDKDEAERLHAIVTEKADAMLQMAPLLERAVERKLELTKAQIAQETARAAQEAAEGAVAQSHREASQAAQELLQEAHRARRTAFRQSGGFWSWMTASAAVGGCVAVLAFAGIQGRADASTFGTFTSLYCSTANGTKFTATDGKDYCAVPLD